MARHGQLFAQDNRIIDQSGQPVQLTGMSLFWSQWAGQYWNADVVSWLASDFKVDLVRAAMGVDHGGYLINPEQEKAKMKAVVNASIAAGIYVLVDWHSNNAEESIPQAKAFFDEMAREYGHFPNVLWETFNEPIRQDWSSVIKPYHEQLVPIIRAHSQNLISLGTSFYSQHVDEACGDPVSGSNLVYSIHLIAEFHKAELRQRVQNAIDSGCAVFATEWLTGYQTLDLDSAQQWVDFFASRQISNVNFAVFGSGSEHRVEAVLTLSASASGGWTDSQLTPSGRWVRNYLRGGNECERQASEDACSQYKPTDSYCFCSWGGDFCTMACA